jgi:hypothetical protein
MMPKSWQKHGCASVLPGTLCHAEIVIHLTLTWSLPSDGPLEKILRVMACYQWLCLGITMFPGLFS